MRQPDLFALVVEFVGNCINTQVTRHTKDNPHFEDQTIWDQDNIRFVDLYPFECRSGSKGVALNSQVIQRAVARIVHIYFFAHQGVLRIPQRDLFYVSLDSFRESNGRLEVQHGDVFK